MVQPVAPIANQEYDIFLYDDGVQGRWLGGTYDATSASVLAAAFFTAFQQIYPTQEGGVGVVDRTGNVIAYLEWTREGTEGG
jgi:hypothetical protein